LGTGVVTAVSGMCKFDDTGEGNKTSYGEVMVFEYNDDDVGVKMGKKENANPFFFRRKTE